MLSEWDMSGLRLRSGRCTGTVDLLRYDTRNEDLIHEKRSRDRTLQLPTVEAFKRSVLLRDSNESMLKA